MAHTLLCLRRASMSVKRLEEVPLSKWVGVVSTVTLLLLALELQ